MAEPEEVRGCSDHAPCGVVRANVQRVARGCMLPRCAAPVQLLAASCSDHIDDVQLQRDLRFCIERRVG